MTKEEKYESLVEQFIEKEELTISKVQIEGNTSLVVAEQVYEEWKNYYDEIYWHNAIYEISFMDEVPTPVRIMNMFNISYYFATKLYERYIELCNDYGTK